MIAIDNVLISDDVIERKFVCNLKACQGACCWEGDYGAPVSEDEMVEIDEILDQVMPILSKESQDLIQLEGWDQQYGKDQWHGTHLHEDGSCVFLINNELGHAQCAFEKLWSEGKISYRKPLSCQMYPIRVISNPEQGFEAWNYDEWDICSAACSLGEELKVPVYEFLKEAIIRAKGEEFYSRLEATVEQMKKDE